MADVYKQNQRLIEAGVIRGATKLQVLTIGLGKVSDLKDLESAIWRDKDGKVVVSTKDNPDGICYEQNRTLVVRVIGGKVLINGRYDMYCPDPSKIGKLLSNPVNLDHELNAEQLGQLQPLFEAATEVVPSMAPAEYGRKVIVITSEMLNGADHLFCELPLSWTEGVPTIALLYKGDIFLVEDVETGKGYRIGKGEFDDTHVIVD